MTPIKHFSITMHSINQIHAVSAENSIRCVYNLLAFGVSHALRVDFKGTVCRGNFISPPKLPTYMGMIPLRPLEILGRRSP